MKSARPSAPLGIAAVAAVVLAMVALGGSNVALGSAASQLLWFLVMFVVIIPAHELGHAIVGALVGYRIRAIVIGVGPALLQGQVAGVTIRVNLLPFGGVTMGMATGTSWPRLRMWLFAAGGPAANLALCLLLKRHTGHGGLWTTGDHGVAATAVSASWAVLILNLLPFRTGEGQMSDGYSLFTVPFWNAERVLRARVVAGGAPVLLALQQGDMATAESALSALRARHGDHPVVLGCTGMLHHRALRHDEARVAWRGSLAAETDPFGALLMKNNIAWADFLLDDRDSATEADACSADALAGRPDLAAFTGTRGAVLDWLGRPGEALPLLERAVASQADARGQASNHACLAMALAHLGRRSEAAAHLASARALDPSCELLGRAEAAVAAADPAAPDVIRVAPIAPSIWDRWGGLLRWRQAARGLAIVMLVIPSRSFEMGLLACLMAVLLDPEPAGLGGLGAIQIALGIGLALDPPSGGDPVGALTVAWMVGAGLAAIALALIRNRLGPGAPSRTPKVLGWVLGLACGFRLLMALEMGRHAVLHATSGSVPLFVAFAAVLLANRRPAWRIAALVPAGMALLAMPAALDGARDSRRVAAIPPDGPPIVWADPRPAKILRERDVPGSIGSAVLSPSGQSLVIDDDLDQEPDEPSHFRLGGFTGRLVETSAFAALLPDDERVAVVRQSGAVKDGAELAMLPRADLQRPLWVKPLPGVMAPGASLVLEPERRTILVLAGSFRGDGGAALRVPLDGSGQAEKVQVSPVGDVMGQMSWYLTPDGGLGRAALVTVGLGRHGGGRAPRGELWVSSPGGPLRLEADLPGAVLLPIVGRPELWCLATGTVLRIDPINRTIHRVADDQVTGTWPISLGPSKLAFAERGWVGVLDLAARRGTWLTTTRRINNVAAGGLGALSYEPGTNTTTVAVLAEP